MHVGRVHGFGSQMRPSEPPRVSMQQPGRFQINQLINDKSQLYRAIFVPLSVHAGYDEGRINNQAKRSWPEMTCSPGGAT